MGRQRHVHLVVDVEPFRVVVHLLGHEGDPAHEAPGFIEGLEGEALADRVPAVDLLPAGKRSEEHTSELQSLMRISYAVFCLKKKTTQCKHHNSLHVTVIAFHTTSLP